MHAIGEGKGLWLDVAASVRDFLGADSANFICHDKQTAQVLALEQVGLDDGAVRDYSDYYYQLDDSTRRHWNSPAGIWFTSTGDTAQKTLHDRIFWGDFMRPHGIGQITGVVVACDDRFTAALSVQKMSPDVPGFQQRARIEAYGKLLCKAFSARQQNTEAHLQILGNVLEAGREGYLVVNARGQLLFSGPGLPDVMIPGTQLAIAQGQLVHRLPVWHRRLLGQIEATARTGQSCALALPDGWGRSYRLAMRRIAADLNFGLATAIGIRIERRDIFHVPSAVALQELFSLSVAEGALCHYLVAGLSISDCADVLGVTVNTLRKQLASILKKTGCRRQSELIRLATGL
ncbi:hypothetical protein AU476_26300 [Cupriavidus sp. UYMSc13B]|nr:hypothetical protein AU476_26300 [Cupriavidus sp. UYMSc13B]